MSIPCHAVNHEAWYQYSEESAIEKTSGKTRGDWEGTPPPPFLQIPRVFVSLSLCNFRHFRAVPTIWEPGTGYKPCPTSDDVKRTQMWPCVRRHLIRAIPHDQFIAVTIVKHWVSKRNSGVSPDGVSVTTTRILQFVVCDVKWGYCWLTLNGITEFN